MSKKTVFSIMNEKQIIKRITEKILQYDISKLPPTLYDGKAGICLFLFAVSKILKDTSTRKRAERLLDELCKNCEKEYLANKIDFGIGISGIAFAIKYLINNKYIDADDDVLKDFDDSIFRWLSSKNVDELTHHSDILYGILYYLIYSIKKTDDQECDAILLKKELVILIINSLEVFNDRNNYIFFEPFIFDINYRLPVYIYLIAEIYKLNFYNYKLDIVINNLTLLVQKTFPHLMSHRIYLAACLRHLISVKYIPTLAQRLKLLEDSINIEIMLSNEFKDKNIDICNGVSGLLLLLLTVPESNSFTFKPQLCEMILQKIEKSSLSNKPEQDKNIINIINGLCGTAMVLSIYGIEKGRNDK